jgi:radical SAM protein with 4Fe4S-binding SPASM domain
MISDYNLHSKSGISMRMYEAPKEGDLEEIKIELTKDCPLACIHCSSKAYLGNSIQLSRDLVLSLIDQAVKLGVKSIVFSGGEPLMWPWLGDAITTCAENNLSSSIYSTGINPRGNGTQQIIDLAKRGLSRVIFSIHSPFKEHHEEITRSGGSFDKTVATIQAVSGKVASEIHFVPLKRNFGHLVKLIEFAEYAGVDKISILRFVPQGRGMILKRSREMLTLHEIMDLRTLILKCRQQSGLSLRLGSPYNIMMLENNVDCIAARQTLCIGPNGNVYPCDAFKNIEPEDIGLNDPCNNVATHSLRECWEKSKYLNAIRHYLTTPFGEPCAHCHHLQQCKSGCLAQKVLEQESIENGNITKRPDPLCLVSMMGG